MLDQRTAVLLEATNYLCERGYTVLEIEELLDYFPQSLRPEIDSFALMLDHLVTCSFIDVKYRDEKQVCLCPLPKGRSYFEEQEEGRKKEELLLKRILIVGIGSSFVGGLVGGLMAGLV